MATSERRTSSPFVQRKRREGESFGVETETESIAFIIITCSVPPFVFGFGFLVNGSMNQIRSRVNLLATFYRQRIE